MDASRLTARDGRERVDGARWTRAANGSHEKTRQSAYWRKHAIRGRLIDVQVAEVGRLYSGAVKSDDKRGPKFRAPYRGYSLTSTQADSVQKSTLTARLGRCPSKRG